MPSRRCRRVCRLDASLDPELDQLTAREREVMRLIARGYTYKEVARELSISVKTVETHVSSVLRKLQLSTRHQLTRWATERRLSETPVAASRERTDLTRPIQKAGHSAIASLSCRP